MNEKELLGPFRLKGSCLLYGYEVNWSNCRKGGDLKWHKTCYAK